MQCQSETAAANLCLIVEKTSRGCIFCLGFYYSRYRDGRNDL